jgi:hypothetical protein
MIELAPFDAVLYAIVIFWVGFAAGSAWMRRRVQPILDKLDEVAEEHYPEYARD